jgi:flagellar biosynthesis/type III secretory pathway protein FliH
MSDKQQTAVEWIFNKMFDPTYSSNTQIEWLEHAKEMENDEMELAIIKQCAEKSTSEASKYAEGYSEGYKRALEYMYQVIYTQIKTKQ